MAALLCDLTACKYEDPVAQLTAPQTVGNIKNGLSCADLINFACASHILL